MSLMLLGILNSQAAGGVEGAYDLLETTTLTSSASSVTFSSLGAYSDYAHLQIRMVARSDWSSVYINDVDVTFNSISSASYASHTLYGDGNQAYSTGSTSANFIRVKDVVPSANTLSSAFGAAIIDILDFSKSSKNTTTRQLSGAVVADETKIVLGSGLLNNTVAVTSINLASSNGSYVTGSRFSLYGIKGA